MSLGFDQPLLMLELLVPPEKAQLEKLNGDRSAYDSEVRPRRTVQAIRELRDAHVEPDVSKVDGLNSKDDCERIVTAARRDGRDQVSCMVLCCGTDEKKILKWLTIAAGVRGFVGFAVGRPDFRQPLAIWRAKEGTCEELNNCSPLP